LVQFLGQAVTAADILITGTDQLNKAFSDTDKTLQNNSGSYQEYLEAITATYVAGGRMEEGERQTMLAMYANGGAIESQTTNLADLLEYYGIANEELQTQARVQNNAAQATQSLADNWQGLGELYAKTPDAIAAANAEIERQAKAADASKESIQLLQAVMAGAVGKEMEDFRQKQYENSVEAVKLQSEIGPKNVEVNALEQSVKELDTSIADMDAGINAMLEDYGSARVGLQRWQSYHNAAQLR
jgi:chromosome segregation ATPase